jgi:hypothetical protein
MLPMTFAQNVDKRELNFKEETGIWKDESSKLDTDTRIRKQKNSFALSRITRDVQQTRFNCSSRFLQFISLLQNIPL